MAEYYNAIAASYDELYEDEQRKKCAFAKNESPWIIEGKILDVGCGTGVSAEAFNADVGIDPAEELLAIADKRNSKRLYIIGKAGHIHFDNDEFDYVISITAIQNFDDIKKGLQEIRRVGKRFILSFLKRTPKQATIESIICSLFSVRKKVEEEKDFIFFCEK